MPIAKQEKPSLARRVVSATKSVTRGFVVDAVFDRRQLVCAACPSCFCLKGIHYCARCGCPPIPLFALRAKNMLRGWTCLSPDDEQRRKFEAASVQQEHETMTGEDTGKANGG